MTTTRRFLRRTLVLVVWPLVHVADRLRGIDPPASLRRGMEWADGVHEPTIPTATKPAAIHPRPVAPPPLAGQDPRMRPAANLGPAHP